MEGMDYFIGVRLNKELQLFLNALTRRSGKSRSDVIRSLIEKGYVKERISRDQIKIIQDLRGEKTNLNQLARKANTFGFREVSRKCEDLVEKIDRIMKGILNDG